MRFYVDTSVFGGYFEAEFAEWTKPFIKQVMEGAFTIIISDITLKEIGAAPLYVRELLTSIPQEFIEPARLILEQESLAKHYISEGALTKKFESDAFHIAIATTLKADSLVSWNFKHMVNFFRIRQYNAVMPDLIRYETWICYNRYTHSKGGNL